MRHLIIGLGSIGKRHAQNLLENGEEVVGVDIDINNSFNFPVYNDIETGWKAEPDMAWICTPTNLHAGQAVEALKRGLHLFIEKPLSNDMESANIVKKAWDEMTVKRMIWIGCNMRFHPGIIRLKDSIDEGLIGNPIIYRFHFSHYLPNMRPGTDYCNTYAAHDNQGGGIVLDNIHDINLVLWFAGPVKKIVSISVNSGTLDMDAEDIAHISILHVNGIFSEIHMDFLRRDKSRGIEVIGEEGTLEWRSLGKNPERAVLNLFKAREENIEQLWEKQICTFDEMFKQQFDIILKTISKPENYIMCFTEAVEALKIALKVKENRN